MKNIYSKFKKMYTSNFASSNKNVFISAILCLLLSFVSVFSFNFIKTNADTPQNEWKNYMTSFGASNGVYKVSTPGQLAYVFFGVASASTISTRSLSSFISTTLKVELVDNIDLSAHYWGTSTVNCDLDFDGKYHVITGLYNSTNENGLVGKSAAGTFKFKNLNLSLNFETKSGTIVAIGGFVGNKTAGNTTFENCKTYGNVNINYSAQQNSIINDAGPSNTSCVGGFVGSSKMLNIKNCTNNIQIVSLSNKNYISCAGGFAGYITNTCTCELSGNFGRIFGAFLCAGGLVGYANGLKLSNSKCFNSAEINSSYRKGTGFVTFTSTIGGLVGYVKSVQSSLVSYAYNNGFVSSTGVGGGIIGNSDVSLSFKNVYNSGDVYATKYISGGSSGTGSVTKPASEVKRGTKYEQYFKQRNTSTSYTINVNSITADYKYSGGGVRDVSLIGNDSLMSSKANAYTVKPSCVSNNSSSGMQISDYKFTFNISLIKNDGSTVNSVSLSTGYFSNIKNLQAATILAYYDEKYLSKYMYDEIYYVDALFSNLYIPLDYGYVDFEETYLSRYLIDANLLYIYTMIDNEKQDYQQNGLPGYYSDKIINMSGNFAVNEMTYAGVRMYICRYADDPDDPAYCIYIFPLIKFSYERGGGIKGEIHVPAVQDKWDSYLSYSEYQYLSDLAYDDLYDNNPTTTTTYYTLNQIKSASFEGSVYGTKSTINNGLPVFKEMYWELV